MKYKVKEAIQIIADDLDFQFLCVKWLFEGEIQFDDPENIFEIVEKCNIDFKKLYEQKCKIDFKNSYEKLCKELNVENLADDDSEWDVKLANSIASELIKTTKKYILEHF